MNLTKRVLSHYRDSATDYTATNGYSSAAHDEIARLIDQGLLEERDDTERESGIVITAAGVALLESLQ